MQIIFYLLLIFSVLYRYFYSIILTPTNRFPRGLYLNADSATHTPQWKFIHDIRAHSFLKNFIIIESDRNIVAPVCGGSLITSQPTVEADVIARVDRVSQYDCGSAAVFIKWVCVLI